MSKIPQFKFLLIIFGAFIAVLGLVFYFRIPHQNSHTVPPPAQGVATTSTPSEIPVSAHSKPTLPTGSQTYKITESAEAWPKILQATINPPDVHVGDTQRLSIVVQSNSPVEYVEARIQTDHGTTTLKLAPAGPTPAAQIIPDRYGVASDRHLVFLDASAPAAIDTKTPFSPEIAHAADSAPVTYTGHWTVKDTHDTYYRTVFAVKDASHPENIVTLAWSDACGIPPSGDWTMNTNCTISSIDGVENGNANLHSGTLTLNADFAFSNSITLSGATIAVGTGSSLKKGYRWVTDADGDLYTPAGFSTVIALNQPSGYSKKSSILGTNDCNDNSSAIYQLLNGYADNDGDGYGAGTVHSLCSGDTLAPPYVADNTDCYDLNANAYPGQTAYFTSSRGDGSFDYNCDGSQEQQYTGITTCDFHQTNPNTCAAAALGWISSVPACGVSGGVTNPYLYNCGYNGVNCLLNDRVQTQACR